MPNGQWNMSNPKSIEVLENVFTQLAEDFPGDLIHLGMDELNKNCVCAAEPEHANDSPEECLAYIKKEF